MKIGIATYAFFSCFKHYFPNLEVVKYNEVESYDLVIFSGGADIDPRIYGQKNLYSRPNPRRDAIELPILRKCLDLNIKILGVCRGHQLINAYLGGKLVQDIRIQLKERHRPVHKIYFVTDTKLANIFPMVNSLHHQAVIYPGKGLIPTSYYGKSIESTESESIISVQWHPELMYGDIGIKFFDYINTWIIRK